MWSHDFDRHWAIENRRSTRLQPNRIDVISKKEQCRRNKQELYEMQPDAKQGRPWAPCAETTEQALGPLSMPQGLVLAPGPRARPGPFCERGYISQPAIGKTRQFRPKWPTNANSSSIPWRHVSIIVSHCLPPRSSILVYPISSLHGLCPHTQDASFRQPHSRPQAAQCREFLQKTPSPRCKDK